MPSCAAVVEPATVFSATSMVRACESLMTMLTPSEPISALASELPNCVERAALIRSRTPPTDVGADSVTAPPESYTLPMFTLTAVPPTVTVKSKRALPDWLLSVTPLPSLRMLSEVPAASE
jgi:hypothetical protein